MSESKEVIGTMRNMAWERAKGELNSILCTYYNDDYYEFKSLLNIFITNIEDLGLQE